MGIYVLYDLVIVIVIVDIVGKIGDYLCGDVGIVY